MTNHELQRLLSKLPPDANVWINGYDYEGSFSLTELNAGDITVDEDGDIIIT